MPSTRPIWQVERVERVDVQTLLRLSNAESLLALRRLVGEPPAGPGWSEQGWQALCRSLVPMVGAAAAVAAVIATYALALMQLVA